MAEKVSWKALKSVSNYRESGKRCHLVYPWVETVQAIEVQVKNSKFRKVIKELA